MSDDLEIYRTLGRMQGAVSSALITLDVYAVPALEGFRRDAVIEAVAQLKSALERSDEWRVKP